MNERENFMKLNLQKIFHKLFLHFLILGFRVDAAKVIRFHIRIKSFLFHIKISKFTAHVG